LIASFLQVGELVRQADGSVALVVSVRSVPGAADMWARLQPLTAYR
jgi:hypothetical protein